MNLGEKRGLVPAEHFEGPVLGLFFLPKRVPLMVGPPWYRTTTQDSWVYNCLHCSKLPAQTEIETGRSVCKVTVVGTLQKVSRHIQLGLKKGSTVNHSPSVKRICRASNPAGPGTIIVYEHQDMFAPECLAPACQRQGVGQHLSFENKILLAASGPWSRRLLG